MFYAEWILPYHHLSTLGNHVGRAALANSYNATIGFNFYNSTRLVEKRFCIPGSTIIPYFDDFYFRMNSAIWPDKGKAGQNTKRTYACSFNKFSSVHHID